MLELLKILQELLNLVFFLFGIFVVFAYLALAVISAFALIHYMRKNSFVDYNKILSSPFAPSVSVIAPAFNEGKTIIDNVHALLHLYYQDYDILIVNDGSKDDTLSKLIESFSLKKVTYAVDFRLEHKEIIGIYKSTNQSFGMLTVIDKRNGGKADALNAGINVSRKDVFVVIDVDSILEQDALLRLAKPFLEQREKTVLTSGSVIRIANSCEIESGKIINVNYPKEYLAKFQVLEYNRSFLMGRMAWAKLNGLLLISGAMGMFNRDVIIDCGGYSTKTVGEDMELIVRVRRHMEEINQKYDVVYIPDPLCWTEVPTSLKILGNQRNRWTRGNMGTLFMHRKIFFNPQYGTMGMLGYPYWFIFEWLAPLMEFFGLIYFIFLAVVGASNWPFFLMLLTFVYSFAIVFSTWSILFEELTFDRYKKKTDLIKLFFTALIEPFLYHPLTVFWSLMGNYDYFRGKKTWGKMERHGFTHSA
ncbi:MAG: glycosyltransferase [Bacteroidota bacterium]|nr:glycosyltransferase [Bacteroidota bacterium]